MICEAHDLLKKYIDLIHKRQKELFRKRVRPKRYYIVIDELIALIASANKQHQIR